MTHDIVHREMVEEDDEQAPLLEAISEVDATSQEPLKRTGTQWTAVAHIITGVIGAGVLSFGWSVAQLGWILGPLCVICFAGITAVSSNFLCDCYRYPDPEYGTTRNQSLIEAVQLYLGENAKWICGVFAYVCLYGPAIAYVITAAASVKAILESNCYHREGHDAPCEYGDTFYILLFGLIQIIVSQIPDFHNMSWLSFAAAAMSFTYSSIGIGLGIAQVIENGAIKGGITGVSYKSITEKLFAAFEALGDIAFAYPYAPILLQIQDTLESPPPETQTMKKASYTAIFITTVFYLCCGCVGYAAFGHNTPGNLLTGFGFYEPYWLVDFANACVVLHLVGGYQIYSQPVFIAFEKWLADKYPNNPFVNNSYSLKLPLLPAFQISPLRICFRTLYVVSTTIIAILFPYFNSVIGALGALNVWPLAIYFPVEMHFVQNKVGPWTKKWILLQVFSFLCLIITVVGFIGSVEELISAKIG